jgi:SAM-dependent methyltransferase
MPAMDYSQVAEIYDIYASTQMDIPFFLEESKNCSRVLELAAGTGRLSLPLIQSGVPLACLDSSPEMLAILERKLEKSGLKAPTILMDMCHFSRSEKYDFIFIAFNSFAEIIEPALQIQCLNRIRRHLTPTGKFICTLHNAAIRRKTVDGRLHFRGKHTMPDSQGDLHLWSLEEDDSSDNVVRGMQFYEMFDSEGKMKWRRCSELRFYLHSESSIATLFQKSGFRTRKIWGDYQRHAFDSEVSPYMIWVLE